MLRRVNLARHGDAGCAGDTMPPEFQSLTATGMQNKVHRVKHRAGKLLPLIGWREWVALPQLGIGSIKAKVDTGARSSSLYAFDIEPLRRYGKRFVRFKVHPLQRSTRTTVTAEAELLEYRHVRSSGGHQTWRPVIVAEVELLGQIWPVELTLASRDAMGFRMLLGRQAIRGRFAVDAGHSFLATRRPHKTKNDKGTR